MKTILASTSPNRKALFDRLGIQFEVAAPDYEEIIIPNRPPKEQVAEFALGKAKSVADQFGIRSQPPQLSRQLPFKKGSQGGDILILGFDSMADFEGGSVGKPKSKKSAFEMLQSFRGKPQKIVSGVAMVGMFKGKYFESVDVEETHIYFRADTTNCQLKKYLEFGDWSGKCGAYSILGTGQFLLEKIDGDFQNVVGVPVMKMGEMVREVTGKSPFTIFEPAG